MWSKALGGVSRTVVGTGKLTSPSFILQLSCLQETIPAAGCSLLNTTCQCESTELMSTTSNCMLANCTLVDTFGTYLPPRQ
jgi:hypothetical protein